MNKRKQREQVKEILKKRIKAIERLLKKNVKESHNIHLPNIALGDLRPCFSPRHKELHSAVRQMTLKFKRYLADASKLLEVYGSDDGRLVVRVHLDNMKMMKELDQIVKDLSRGKNR